MLSLVVLINLLKEFDVDLNDDELNKSATKIQAGFRGKKAREEVQQMKNEELSKQENKNSSSMKSVRDEQEEKTREVEKEVTQESQARVTENEIDIDLNDPAVGKVAAQLQTGFFSKFGKKAEDMMIMERKCSELKIVKIEKCFMDQLTKNK